MPILKSEARRLTSDQIILLIIIILCLVALGYLV